MSIQIQEKDIEKIDEISEKVDLLKSEFFQKDFSNSEVWRELSKKIFRKKYY